MSKSFNFYTVWAGRKTGIFNTWRECELSISGYKGSLFKGFKTLDEANMAFEQGYYSFYGITPPNDALNELQMHSGFPKATNDSSEAPF